MLYNPRLSISDNAAVNKVSESYVRKYIKERCIDRMYDEKFRIHEAVNQYASAHQGCTITEISENLNHSINTVKKYLNKPFNETLKEGKVSAFNMNLPRNLVKSVSSNQADILNGILALYVKGKQFDADLTYSKGLFYKHVKQPRYKYDKFPILADVRPLSELNTVKVSRFDSIVIDLPFVIRKGNQNALISDRFSSFATIEELKEVNTYMLELAAILLRKGGVLVFKTQNTSIASRNVWTVDYAKEEAKRIGLNLLDEFILIDKTPMGIKGQQQKMARKIHSTFLVFKK